MRIVGRIFGVLVVSATIGAAAAQTPPPVDALRPFGPDPAVERRIDDLLGRMTLAEKLGQLRQGGWSPDFDLEEARSGRLGSITNPEDPVQIARIQKAAR